MATNCVSSAQLSALRKKRVNVRRAHHASATKLINQVESVAASDACRLRQLKQSLTDKLALLERLDEEVMELTEDEEELLVEVEQADGVKDKIKLAVIVIDDYLTPQGDDAPSVDGTRYTPPSENVTNQDSRRTVRFREDDRDSVSEENQNLLCARTESSLFTPSIPVSTVSTTSFNTSPVTTTSPFAPLWTVPPLLGTPLHNATFTGLPQPALSLTELKTGSRPTLRLPPFGLVSSSSSLLPNPSHITSLPHFSVPSVNPAVLPPFADAHTHLARTPDAFAGSPVTNLNVFSHSGAASEYPSQSHIPSVNCPIISIC